MGILGELEAHRPTFVEAILDLRADLVVGEIGQKREAALGDAHGVPPQAETLIDGTKSGESVEA